MVDGFWVVRPSMQSRVDPSLSSTWSERPGCSSNYNLFTSPQFRVELLGSFLTLRGLFWPVLATCKSRV